MTELIRKLHPAASAGLRLGLSLSLGLPCLSTLGLTLRHSVILRLGFAPFALSFVELLKDLRIMAKAALVTS